MKVLVIGAKGQLGACCLLLLRGQHEVEGVDLPEFDLSVPNAVPDLSGVDALINCAAYTAVDRCEQEEPLALVVNAEGPRRLAEMCRRAGIRFIHLSTDYVFSGQLPVPQPYKENDQTGPLSAYGRTKRAGERAVLECGGNAVVLRTAWLYDAGGRNFFKTILRAALLKPGGDLRIVNDQYGSPTWAFRLACQIETLLESRCRGLAHASAEGYGTWYDAACIFLDAMDVKARILPCKSAEYQTAAHRPLNSILENAVLKERGENVFVDWRADLRSFAGAHRDALMEEARNLI